MLCIPDRLTLNYIMRHGVQQYTVHLMLYGTAPHDMDHASSQLFIKSATGSVLLRTKCSPTEMMYVQNKVQSATDEQKPKTNKQSQRMHARRGWVRSPLLSFIPPATLFKVLPVRTLSAASSNPYAAPAFVPGNLLCEV